MEVLSSPRGAERDNELPHIPFYLKMVELQSADFFCGEQSAVTSGLTTQLFWDQPYLFLCKVGCYEHATVICKKSVLQFTIN